MRPGYKTTEFWLSFVAMLLGAVMASGLIPAEGMWPQILGMAISALAAMGYTGSRGKVKAAGALAGMSGENLPALGEPKPDPTDG